MESSTAAIDLKVNSPILSTIATSIERRVNIVKRLDMARFWL
jgi:hypothetical protein